MVTKKIRRHSGRYTPNLNQKIKFSEMIENALEPQEEYDDWIDYRDGLRGSTDKTLIRKKGIGYDKKLGKGLDLNTKKENIKLKKHAKIRKAKKLKKMLFFL